MSDFIPKSIVCLREGYTRERVLRDLLAGVVVGIVALPLALAFAIASGVPPERGLYTAIIAGFIIAVLSGSRVQIGGPTGAFILIRAGRVEKYRRENFAGSLESAVARAKEILQLGHPPGESTLRRMLRV